VVEDEVDPDPHGGVKAAVGHEQRKRRLVEDVPHQRLRAHSDPLGRRAARDATVRTLKLSGMPPAAVFANCDVVARTAFVDRVQVHPPTRDRAVVVGVEEHGPAGPPAERTAEREVAAPRVGVLEVVGHAPHRARLAFRQGDVREGPLLRAIATKGCIAACIASALSYAPRSRSRI
jgi:hypothetical protein